MSMTNAPIVKTTTSPRAAAARFLMDREAQGLSADGRVIDAVKYTQHLAGGR